MYKIYKISNLQLPTSKVEIIYQDKDIIAVNKPAGIVVHPDEYYKSGTLIQLLAEKFPEIKNVGDTPSRPGVVHRLDKDTSGILLVARNNKAFEYLKKQFAAAAESFGGLQQERKIRKTYLALVWGKLGKKVGEKGIINLPIARSAKTPILRVARGKTRGELKEAATEYKIIKYLSDTTYPINPKKKFTFVKVYPKTGRTHQIRTHFKAVGNPVLCDKLYAQKLECPFGLTRHFLHAYSLEFTTPSGTGLRLEAELPDDLKNFLNKLK